MMNWYQGLNPEQQKAVAHNDGPLLILAGAGSGKTTVLVSRTGRLVQEKKTIPERICVLTFTNKAARELKHRVKAKLGLSAGKIWSGTFHSFGLMILRKYYQEAHLSSHFGIIDQSDSIAILRELLKDVRNSTKDKFDIDKILQMINKLRIDGKIQNPEISEYLEMAELLLPKYLKKMEILGVVDFEGLLLKPLEIFQNNKSLLMEVQNLFDYVMVDEFQDTNVTQMKLIQNLVKSHRNVAVVGDDDQSIYGWRGAEVKNILDFPKIYKPCEVIKLERNYRSSSEILSIANNVIAKNKNRHGKILRAETQKVEKPVLPEVFILEKEDDESEFVANEIRYFLRKNISYNEMAVLYRSNTQGGLIESVLRHQGIPYSITGGVSLFDRKEVKDVLAYLKFSIFPNEMSLRRIINTPHRGIGDATIEKISEYATLHKMSFVSACHRWKEIEISPKVGQELDQLFVLLKTLPEKVLKFSQGSSSGNEVLQFLENIGYRDFVFNSVDNAKAAENRWISIQILCRIMDSFFSKSSYDLKTYKEFIDAMLLRDDFNDDEKDRVHLMTFHASKGLEFPVVILTGLEEDLLPHRTLGSDVDEERRLYYVGITRAKKYLVMSRCQQRKRHGTSRPVAPSRFLLEIPKELYKEYPLGARPVTESERENLVAQFLAQLK